MVGTEFAPQYLCETYFPGLYPPKIQACSPGFSYLYRLWVSMLLIAVYPLGFKIMFCIGANSFSIQLDFNMDIHSKLL